MSMFRKSNITVRIEETTQRVLRYLLQTVFSNFHCINAGLEELRL